MPMKVIVCFDHVRVTVPCGDGNLPVRELIAKAVHRYKRATGKGPTHWVEVSNLKTISGGGILDPDDELSDVVDDREQLIAEFDEQDRPTSSIQHNGGDGASASSTGTVSPEIFHVLGEDGIPIRPEHIPSPATVHSIFPPPRNNSSSSNNTATDVVVTPRDLTIGSSLRVRRGSDPCINLLGDEAPPEKSSAPLSIARPSIPRRESMRDSDEPRSEESDDDKWVKTSTVYGSLDRKQHFGPSRFSRDAFRTSLSNGPEMFRWLDAQERQELRVKDIQAKERTGPVDGHDGKDVNSSIVPKIIIVTLQNDGGPLGIHAVPATGDEGKDIGLLIQSIEPDRPVHRDGRIQPDDTIIDINGTSLQDIPFLRAQEIFRAAMDSEHISLKVLKGNDSLKQQSSGSSLPPSPKTKPAPKAPPVLPKPRTHAPSKPSPLTLNQESDKDRKSTSPVPAPREHSKKIAPDIVSDSNKRSESFRSSERSSSSSNSSTANSSQKLESPLNSKPVAKRPTTVSNNVIKPGPPLKPPKKPAPAIPARSPNTGLSAGQPNDLPLNTAYNTRRIGTKLEIQLRKGPLGLGFSVTSRDNQTDGNIPIYIGNILPSGPALQDGRLKRGDRLLEVNGVEITGKSQAEAKNLLRMLPEGSSVTLLISRQEEVEEKFKVPRKMGDPNEQDTAVTGRESNSEDTPDALKEERNEVKPDLSISQPKYRSNSVEDDSPPGQVTEKITFHVQLNDTGSAGLGVSVKGKTEPTEEGLRDLGIFVNSVLKGGAASKDGRLFINDQLLEVNGVVLEGLSNTAAMEALRSAMMDKGIHPGHSTVTVARRLDTNSMDMFPLDVTDSSQEVNSEPPPIPAHHRTVSSSSDNRVPIYHQRSSSASDASSSKSPRAGTFSSDYEMPSPIPPVRSRRVAALRERFQAAENGGLRNDSYLKATDESMDSSPTGLRNDSYMKATHDTLNESELLNSDIPSPDKVVPPVQYSQSHQRTEIVDNDQYTLPQKLQRPHSTIGFLYDGVRHSVSDDEAFRRESVASSRGDESDLNSLSPRGELANPFAREGFGRQSMSEKRKGHLDPRSTETYKLVKATKENKGATNNDVLPLSGGNITSPKSPLSPSITDAVPVSNCMTHVSSNSTYNPSKSQKDSSPSNLKRASSVEDLSHHSTVNQTAVSAASSTTSVQGRDVSPMTRTNRFGRARACNDSFRAAVDRSYDALDPALMDTLEEESVESGAFTLDPSNSGRSSISSENTSEDTNSLRRRKAKDKDKKTGGLLKGFLRFGKGRKSNEEAMRRSRSEERPGERLVEPMMDSSLERPNVPNDRWAAQPYGDVQNLGFVPLTISQQKGRRVSNQEEERIEEEYARLREFHVSNQRLRSQSVDPTVGRNKLISTSSTERSSPFQPYQGSSQQQQHFQNQLQQFQLQQQHQPNADPRTFHPAAISQGQLTGQDTRGTRQFVTTSQSSVDPSGRPNVTKAVMSRAEYIQQLRSLYQQRHRQRQGVYPLEDNEEFYEKQIQELEKKGWSNENTYTRNSRESKIGHFTDRPSSRQHEESPDRLRGTSPSMSNVLPHSQQNHHQRYHQYPVNTAPHERHIPSPRGGPVNSSFNNSEQFYQHQQHQRDSHNPHSQHHYTHQHTQPYRHEDMHGNHEHLKNNGTYPSHESRPPFYQGPPQTYHSSSHQYNTAHNYRGNLARLDSSSAKV